MSFKSFDRRVMSLGHMLGIVLDVAIAIIIAVLLGIVFSQFIDRNYVPFWRGSPEEYVKIGLTWLCFLGIARAFATDEIIRITFLHELVSPRVALVLDMIVDLLLLFVLLILIWKCIPMIRIAEYQMILGTNLTLAVPAWGVISGFLILAPLILWRVVRRLAIVAGWL